MSTAQAIRAARKFAEAQAHYDAIAEPEPYPDELLTEDEALEQAEHEKTFDPRVLLDAMNELFPSVTKPIPLREIMVEAFDPSEVQAGFLLVMLLKSPSLNRREAARIELQDRIRKSLDECIVERANELLREQERFLEELGEEA